MWSTLVSVAGILISAVGLFLAWTAARRNELRRGEVLDWVNESISCFQTTALLAHPSWFDLSEEDRNSRMQQAAIKASILIERGRMFFKNKRDGSFGAKKEPAYRGIRPLILDELVVLHGLAREWPALAPRKRALAFDIAVAILKRFVSMAQQEVGRERTASTYAASAGDGVSFRVLLDDLESGRSMVRPPIEDMHRGWMSPRLRRHLAAWRHR